MVSIEQKLDTVRFKIDHTAHIVVDTSRCSNCAPKTCVYVCPAHLFELSATGEVLFSYEHCFECGTCYIACSEGAVAWSYPRGGYGVCLREA